MQPVWGNRKHMSCISYGRLLGKRPRYIACDVSGFSVPKNGCGMTVNLRVEICGTNNKTTIQRKGYLIAIGWRTGDIKFPHHVSRFRVPDRDASKKVPQCCNQLSVATPCGSRHVALVHKFPALVDCKIVVCVGTGGRTNGHDRGAEQQPKPSNTQSVESPNLSGRWSLTLWRCRRPNGLLIPRKRGSYAGNGY